MPATLGFRGEALASIVACSAEAAITSKIEAFQEYNQVVYANGCMTS